MERHENHPDLKHYKSVSNASYKSCPLRSWLPFGIGSGALPARGTKRRVTAARQRMAWLLVSASVEMPPPREQTTAASAGPI